MRAFFLSIFFLLSVFAFARNIEIIVEDEDLLMPLEGAIVTLQNREQFFCNRDGVAKVTLPNDRPATVTITYPGYDAFRLSIPAAVSAAEVERFTVFLKLSGIMQSQELVIEASRPETSETRSGRSVAITDRELARTSEIGIIEDVMSSVKLLPGVGYTGMFSAMPSIRGGDPGDLMAVLDGFYLENPYHWMGGISIFEPKMVKSARLSHGVFSARYGHTVSGLLEVTSKIPSNSETEFEAAIGSSAASLNISVPLKGRGGILFMGKVTYWDTFIWAAQQLSRVVDNENLDLINAVSTSPFIRSAALSTNYRVTQNTDWRLNFFFGSDGVGMEIDTDYTRFLDDDGIEGIVETKADYGNYQGFLVTAFTTSPAPKLALRFTGGAGFIYTMTDAFINNNVTVPYNDEFLDILPPLIANPLRGTKFQAPNIDAGILMDSKTFNAQFRADADIELGNGFIAAFGIQELYSLWSQKIDVSLSFLEFPLSVLLSDPSLQDAIDDIPPFLKLIPNLSIVMPRSYVTDVQNHGFTSSAYGLIEYASPNQFFGAELGLRVDHLYFKGRDFSAHTAPAFNPRLNLDFNLIKNLGFIDSFSATAGSGLFSSIPSFLSFFNPSQFGIEDASSYNNILFKFNRSWTNVIGFKLDFLEKYSFNIEGYYKYIFDRAYITAEIDTGSEIAPKFEFDGIGTVWGFDLQLQRLESRFIDGWISYTFTYAKYNDPSSTEEGLGMTGAPGGGWYYPSFHRFHNANIVLNIKPSAWFNIGVRFGFASGRQTQKPNTNEPYTYPVIVMNEDGTFQPTIIQKYRRDPIEDELIRSAWSLPLDIKFSFFPANINGRSHMEIYFAGENMLSLVYNPTVEQITFNEYTGKTERQASSNTFDMPIPMLSFGIKWKY